MSTTRIRGGRISMTRLFIAVCTCGLSIPFIGVRKGPAINVSDTFKGWGNNQPHHYVAPPQQQAPVIVVTQAQALPKGSPLPAPGPTSRVG